MNFSSWQVPIARDTINSQQQGELDAVVSNDQQEQSLSQEVISIQDSIYQRSANTRQDSLSSRSNVNSIGQSQIGEEAVTDTSVPRTNERVTSTIISIPNGTDTSQQHQSSRLEGRSLATFDQELLRDSIAQMDTINLGEAIEGEQATARSYSYEDNIEGIKLPFTIGKSGLVFILLLLSFMLLAHIYQGGFSFVMKNISLILSATKSQKLEEENTNKEKFYSYFLVLIAVFFISISLYEGLSKLIPIEEFDETRTFVTVGLFVVVIFVFILLKVLFNKIIGYIYDISPVVSGWNRSYIMLLSILGLLCFLPTLILVYSDIWHKAIIVLSLLLFLAAHIILFFRLIVYFVGQRFNFLYLIAYLCTVEILPYIYLGIGLVYIYRTDIFNALLL